MAQFNLAGAHAIGNLANAVTGNGTVALSAAATWLAYGFVLPEAKTLSKVQVRVSAVNGTLDGDDLTAEVYSDNAAASPPVPNASLASSATVTSTPTAAANVEFTGFSYALSAATQYYIVLKNAAAVPGTNYPTYTFNNGAAAALYVANGLQSGWHKLHSTDSGTTWGTRSGGAPHMRLEFSDSTFFGLPFTTISNAGSAVGVYSAREYGGIFTFPSNWPPTKIWGLGCYLRRQGTPTAQPFFKLYSGSTPSLVASTGLLNEGLTNGVYVTAYFSALQTLSPGVVYRMVLAEDTNSDTSSNYWSSTFQSIMNDANSKAMMPFGTMHETYYNGSTWAEDTTNLPWFWAVVDSATPFAFPVGNQRIVTNIGTY